MPEHINAAVYSFVMRYAQRENQPPSVLTVAEGCKIGVFAVAQAVGELNWLFLTGSMDDPARCYVEIDGE